jgi:hypothetical protein
MKRTINVQISLTPKQADLLESFMSERGFLSASGAIRYLVDTCCIDAFSSPLGPISAEAAEKYNSFSNRKKYHPAQSPADRTLEEQGIRGGLETHIPEEEDEFPFIPEEKQ